MTNTRGGHRRTEIRSSLSITSGIRFNWHWVLVGANNEVMSTSEIYDTRWSAVNAARVAHPDLPAWVWDHPLNKFIPVGSPSGRSRLDHTSNTVEDAAKAERNSH